MSQRIFLERRTYRRNRLQDAAKLLPVLGAFLFFGPILILTTDAGVAGSTAGWLVYYVAVWLGLIALAAALATALARLVPEDVMAPEHSEVSGALQAPMARARSKPALPSPGGPPKAPNPPRTPPRDRR